MFRAVTAIVPATYLTILLNFCIPDLVIVYTTIMWCGLSSITEKLFSYLALVGMVTDRDCTGVRMVY